MNLYFDEQPFIKKTPQYPLYVTIVCLSLTNKHHPHSLFQLNAAKAADKKFRSTLQSAGINEDLLRTRSSAAPSARSEEYGEEDDDATFSKSRHPDEEEALS